tara:strand:- start:107 stop:841 length:735 start_codon:yes stop_codon:yes gene_type:complete
MPIIYSNTADGYVNKTNQSSWANARDASTGSGTSATNTSALGFVYVIRAAGRGGGITYGVYRSFLFFDTSGITANVASATLSIYGTSATPDGSIIAVKSTAFGGDGGTALATSDFDAISGWSAGSSLAGSATVYGAQKLTSAWNQNAYNDFTATSDLLADMKNNNVVIICLMDYTNDYLNNALTSNALLNVGGFYSNYSGTSRDPKIDYTLATGYANNVNGVASANISKVMGVATANISKINGI